MWRLFEEPLQLFHELTDIPELPIDGCKAHISYLIELMQLMHRELTDLSGGHFPVVFALEVTLDIVDELFNALYAEGPLLAGHHDALNELLALERLAPAVLLYDHEGHALDILIRRESPLALQALAPPPDARSVLRSARVDNAVIPISAVWASHV